MKNLLRGALLAFMATFLGVFVFFTLPDWLASTTGRVLPFWFYESEVRPLIIQGSLRSHSYMRVLWALRPYSTFWA